MLRARLFGGRGERVPRDGDLEAYRSRTDGRPDPAMGAATGGGGGRRGGPRSCAAGC